MKFHVGIARDSNGDSPPPSSLSLASPWITVTAQGCEFAMDVTQRAAAKMSEIRPCGPKVVE